MDEENIEETGVGEEEVKVQSSPLHLKFKNLISIKNPTLPRKSQKYFPLSLG